ncbi:MAG: hypothetical protein ABI969_12110 [bacterium]
MSEHVVILSERSESKDLHLLLVVILSERSESKDLHLLLVCHPERAERVEGSAPAVGLSS